MNTINNIDIFIIIFTLYNVIIGVKNGFVKSIFISFGFIIRIVATYFIYTAFSKMLFADNNIKLILKYIKDYLSKSLPNLAYTDFLDKAILILSIFIFVSIIVFIVFKILKDVTDDDTLKVSDQILGFAYGLVKSLLIMMLIVYFIDKVSDYVLTVQIKEIFANSALMSPLYTYNIFMNLFNV
jgi:colicin V production protein